MAFQSKFELNEKLRLCAARDLDHVGEATNPAADRVGEHVALIHEALNAWARKQGVRPVGGAELSGKRFGGDTGDLVEAYKTANRILNFRGQIDRVVGMKTIAALDKELPARKGGEDPPAAGKVDIIVKFQGAFQGGRILLLTDVFPDARLAAYNKKPNRSLVRMGETTTTIRAASATLLGGFVDRIEAAIAFGKENGRELGKVFVWGTSSGGRNAIDLAARLTGKAIPVEYVAALDAAFFPNESLNRPTNRFGEPSEIPRFNVELVTAATRKNFFQTVGNHSESTARHGILFTSTMAGKEVHGSVTGFLDRDLTAQVRAKTPSSDDDAHIALSKVAREEVVNDIAGVLDGL